MEKQQCDGCINLEGKLQGKWMVYKCATHTVPGIASINGKLEPVERVPGCYSNPEGAQPAC